ncbi:hypothetical protein IQ238_28370 [Pleurocapsales cyanobacterium LEGE 06147]|nr:hypothetical protein [Pleurocapsales cyanobacterium LEGE 06147]
MSAASLVIMVIELAESNFHEENQKESSSSDRDYKSKITFYKEVDRSQREEVTERRGDGETGRRGNGEIGN